jgi:hypothetical protein
MDIRDNIRRGAALAAVLGAGAVLATGPAQAAATAGTHVVSESRSETQIAYGNDGQHAAATAEVPLTSGACGSSTNPAWVILEGTGGETEICAVTTVTDLPFKPYLGMDDAVYNRVWFHQDANNGGWADCFEGLKDVHFNTRDETPGNVQVSSNTAAC